MDEPYDVEIEPEVRAWLEALGPTHGSVTETYEWRGRPRLEAVGMARREGGRRAV